MKITDLFENVPHRMAPETDKLPFDLADDLMFFMRNDDDFYRRHYYPHVVKCKSHIKQGNDLSPKVFAPMVQHAYECYSKKFPMRELPESLDGEMLSEICGKLRTEERTHIKKDIY
jgi:hypothetical protein